MSRQRLSMTIPAAEVPRAEALLTLAGAETIALRDAADDPVFEPEPSTAPLWPNVTLEALFAADADLEPLRSVLVTSVPNAAVTLGLLPETAWQPGLRQAVQARPIGTRLWLAPADDEHLPDDRAVVRINMGLAFGTGAHPTTALCLDWLERHVATGITLIDYGCGSGILALAALALGADRAIAIDNDEQALLATRANAAINGVTERLFVGSPENLPNTTVDVVAANILAGPLAALATTFARYVRPGGWLVLSGILESQIADVASAYSRDFGAPEQAAFDGWVRLAVRRNPS